MKNLIRDIKEAFDKHDINPNELSIDQLLESATGNFQVVKGAGLPYAPDYLLMTIGELIIAYQKEWNKEGLF